MSNIIRKTVAVSDLRQGDTVEINGCTHTVTANRIKSDPFFGVTYEGAAYPQGITKITFVVPTAFGVRYQ